MPETPLPGEISGDGIRTGLAIFGVMVINVYAGSRTHCTEHDSTGLPGYFKVFH